METEKQQNPSAGQRTVVFFCKNNNNKKKKRHIPWKKSKITFLDLPKVKGG